MRLGFNFLTLVMLVCAQVNLKWHQILIQAKTFFWINICQRCGRLCCEIWWAGNFVWAFQIGNSVAAAKMGHYNRMHKHACNQK